MDDFTLKFDQIGSQPDGSLNVCARAVVNGKELPEVLGLCTMLSAIEKSGRYPLFYCTCGDFGCGGYWVDVECTKDAWIWRNGYYPADEDEPEQQWPMYEFEYRIPWSQVRAAIAQTCDEIVEVRENRGGPGFLAAWCEKAFLDFRHHLATAQG
jgi:hypothetical protein